MGAAGFYVFILALTSPNPTPRILPIHARMAHTVVHVWLQEAIANDDESRMKRIAAEERFIQHVHEHDDVDNYVEHGFTCVLCGDRIAAIAHLTRDESDTTTLQWLEAHHTSTASGSVLLYSLIASHDALCVSHTRLDDRWVVAHKYMRSNGGIPPAV